MTKHRSEPEVTVTPIKALPADRQSAWWKPHHTLTLVWLFSSGRAVSDRRLRMMSPASLLSEVLSDPVYEAVDLAGSFSTPSTN